MMNRIHNLKVSVSGVRGIVGDTLTPSLVSGFAAAFGEYVGGGRVIVGRDTRPSGIMLEHAVVAGLLSVGCQPVLLGIVPTPTVQITVDEYKANGGIAITASHNPPEWNALKFVGPSGIFLNETESAELLDVYNQPDTLYVAEQEYRFIRNHENAFDLHSDRVLKNIDCETIRKASFKVAVDCCNGVGAFYSRKFLEKLGCEVITIFDEKDGFFRRIPEPVAANLAELENAVRKHSCVIGFAQDPDGDRLAVVDEKGAAVGEQNSIVLAAEHVLSKQPGDVVVNIQTTKAVQDIAQKYGCKVHYSRVGEIYVTKKMVETAAVIGGEGNSGGIVWPAVHPCRDSFSGMALILEMMAQRGQTISQIMDSLPKYFSGNIKMPCPGEKARHVIRVITEKYARQHPFVMDGFRLNLPDGWVLVRFSNTEPVIRCSVEASSSEKVKEYLDLFTSDIRKLM